jgi:hypothetical protein
MDIRVGDTVGGGGGGGGGGGDKPKKQSAEDRIAAKPFGREIIAAAKANSVDPALFAALVAQESPALIPMREGAGLTEAFPVHSACLS